MSNTIFDAALDMSQEERKLLVLQYVTANTNDTMITESLQVLWTSQKRYWPIAVDILHCIGYPHNKIAISRLVEGLCDGNNPGWQEIIETLKDIPAIIVVPYMIRIILDQNVQREYWVDDVEGMSLALAELGDTYVQYCFPSINYILAKEVDTDNIDLEFLLRIFNKSNIRNYLPVIPFLIRIKQKNLRDDLHEKARSLLENFTSNELNIYKLALDDQKM
jgi:hypothetical protein